MIGGVRTPSKARGREDGEKPFWISFSDLMSALMVLFLVAMSVALLAVTKEVDIAAREEKERSDAIDDLRSRIDKVIRNMGIEGIQRVGDTIDFGERGLFEVGKNKLLPDQRNLLQLFTPLFLSELRDSEAGKRWFKRAVVAGYASQSGTYLFNLNLSIERSERVLCELLREPDSGGKLLDIEDRKFIATKFFVGGASFNDLTNDDKKNRRIEFKIEFKTREDLKKEQTVKPVEIDEAVLAKALDPREKCPIQDRS